MENIILFVVFTPFRYFLLFFTIFIVVFLLHPTKQYGKDHDGNVYAESKTRKFDETISLISFIVFALTFIFAIICLFYYIKF